MRSVNSSLISHVWYLPPLRGRCDGGLFGSGVLGDTIVAAPRGLSWAWKSKESSSVLFLHLALYSVLSCMPGGLLSRWPSGRAHLVGDLATAISCQSCAAVCRLLAALLLLRGEFSVSGCAYCQRGFLQASFFFSHCLGVGGNADFLDLTG